MNESLPLIPLPRAERKRQLFMEVAIVISQLGTCDRSQVGAVIIKDGRCISWGFNGAPPGMPHCDENNHGWGNVDETAGLGLDTYGCKNATHAEANALASAAKQGISTDGAELYVTLSPCEVCSRLLIAAGISRVHFLSLYRDTSGVRLLRAAGIECLGI
jgi:dCMP deaminase